MSIAPVTATVTGHTGPGMTVTGKVLTDVDAISLDFRRGVAILDIGGNSPSQFELQLSDLATATINLSTRAVTLST